MGRELAFSEGQILSIEGTRYRVTGGICFRGRSDGSIWTEYRLEKIGAVGSVRWLSVDSIYQEYAVYTQFSDGRGFDAASIDREGYRQADAGQGIVTSVFGNVDAEPGDRVDYKEYEDPTEELIISVEHWEDETEYSRGYYLDVQDICAEGEGSGQSGLNQSGLNRPGSDPLEPGQLGPDDPAYRRNEGGMAGQGVWKPVLSVSLFLLIPVIIIGIVRMGSGKMVIAKYLKENTQFSYETSITSDLNQKEKADVYTTFLSVDEAAKAVIEAVEGNTESVQAADEEKSVAILTKTEYCLVYQGTDSKTRVQISSRAYVYQSTNTPYRSSPHTHAYYRGFYFSRGWSSDRNRYKKAASGYDGYTGNGVELDTLDTYHSYSNSIRQSSVNSRRSSGGGIRSGK